MAATVDDMTDNLKLVASNVEKFCTQFYKIYSNSEECNIICSPLSVDVVLSMLSYGTGGSTQQQLNKILAIRTNDDSFKTGYGNLVDFLGMTNSVDLSIANKMFLSITIPIKNEYLQLSEKNFRSALEHMDFSDANTATKLINTWCAKQTKEKIKEIVKPSYFNSDTTLVLINAIYFKGQWKDKFDPLKTSEMPFYTDKTNFKNVPTMKKTSKYNNGFINELMASFIEIPYVGEELSMVLILPVEFGGLEYIKENIDKINITEVLKTGFYSTVELHLPKFQINTTINLQPTLEKMGMGELFTNQADLSNMTNISVKVSKAIQTACIIVNEDGNEDTTNIMQFCVMSTATLPKCFSINQPFLFKIVKIIRDKDDIRVALPLFAGIVHEPKFEDL